MTDWTLPMDGGCRCGKVRLRISKPPIITMLCHCTGCQRMTASAFSTTIMVPTDGFEVTEGETVIGGIHGELGHHHHCGWCKSWMFTRVPPEYGPFVNVRATMLDDATWFVPFAEVFTSEALPWAIAGAPHAYEKFPPMEDYQTLIGAFAES
jgi:hypothetical protein